MPPKTGGGGQFGPPFSSQGVLRQDSLPEGLSGRIPSVKPLPSDPSERPLNMRRPPRTPVPPFAARSTHLAPPPSYPRTPVSLPLSCLARLLRSPHLLGLSTGIEDWGALRCPAIYICGFGGAALSCERGLRGHSNALVSVLEHAFSRARVSGKVLGFARRDDSGRSLLDSDKPNTKRGERLLVAPPHGVSRCDDVGRLGSMREIRPGLSNGFQ